MSACEEALSYLEKSRVDECEAIAVKKRVTTVRVTDSCVAEIKHNTDENLGIRIIHGKKIASVQTTGRKENRGQIDDALGMLSNMRPREFWKGLPDRVGRHNTVEKTFDVRLQDVSGSKVADIAQAMINAADHRTVKAVTGSVNVVSEDFELRNSNGLHFRDKSTYISAIINAHSDHGAVPVSGIGYDSRRTLSDFSPEQVGHDAKTMCVESVNPQKIDTDVYTVIFEPYSVGEILTYVLAENFNFKRFSEKKSCFSRDYKKEIAPGGFSLIDNPHLPDGIGSKPVDDEGVRTDKVALIENGIFEGTLSNLFDSYKEGGEKASTGNALRVGLPMGRSAEPIPVSAPHNLEIVSDGNNNSGNTSSQEEMIKDTKHGLLVGRLWYTYAVNPIRGDFACTARSGIRIIEDGEIKSPGRTVRIIHNLPDMLKSISEIGNAPRNVVQWAAPFASTVPSIKVEKIPVMSI